MRKLSLLLYIILAGFILRFIGIWYGLPYPAYFSADESIFVHHAMHLGTGDLNPHYFRCPSLFIYLLFGEYGILFLLGKIFGFFKTQADFARLYFSNSSMFYLLGRLTSCVFGTALIPVCFLIGKKIFSRKTGLIAALFLAASFINVKFSHIIKADMLATFLLLMCFYFIFSIYELGDTKYYVLAGLFGGLAIAAKYNVGILVVPFLLAHVLYSLKVEKRWQAIFCYKRIYLGLASLVFGFLIAMPYAALDFINFGRSFITVAGMGVGEVEHIGYEGARGIKFVFLKMLPYGIGIPLTCISILGIFYAFYKLSGKTMLLLSFSILYIGILLYSNLLDYHYVIPVIPFLFIVGANAIDKITQKVPLMSNRKRRLLIFVICLLVVEPFIRSVKFDFLVCHKDLRTLAKEWIEENIPPGTKVLLDGLKPYNPPLTLNRKSLLKMYEGQIKLGYLLNNVPLKSYEVDYIRHSLEYTGAPKDIGIGRQDLRERGYEFVIVNSYMYDRYLRLPEGQFEHTKQFYGQLDMDFELVKEFIPNSYNRPGPWIKIYKIE